jgi:hypothetical protein
MVFFAPKHSVYRKECALKPWQRLALHYFPFGTPGNAEA